jgi:Raf kinase inhibitor-like YbhB/YbcL family protein
MRRVAGLLAGVGTFAAVAQAGGFELTSPTVKNGSTLTNDQVFNGFDCEGKNLSPALNWSSVPKGTQSLALTVFDPDAPSGSGWWHWTVVNILSSATGLAEGAGSSGGKLPEGAVQGRDDFGATGFGGAGLPKGDHPHRYVFTLWALKSAKLDVDGATSGALVGFLVRANSISKAALTARYGR